MKLKTQNSKLKSKGKLCTLRFAFRTDSGFTLVEMIVALAVFAIVAVVAVGALLKITDANRKSQTLSQAINNINFAFESMTREIRVGSAYDCVGSGAFSGSSAAAASCDTIVSNDPQGSSIAFLSTKTAPASPGTCNLTYAYWFQPIAPSNNTWTISKAQQSSCNSSIDSTSYTPVMDPSVVITSYSIQVVANDLFSNVQPKAFVYMSGYVGATAAQRTYFDLQTTISERI